MDHGDPGPQRAVTMVAKVCPGMVPVSPVEPYFLRLRQRLPWWEDNASTQVLHLVKGGVPLGLGLPLKLPIVAQYKTAVEVA